MGPSWGQYGTHVDGAGQGGIFVHSIACGSANSYNLPVSAYLKLGSPASHGCIRTCVADAKWYMRTAMVPPFIFSMEPISLTKYSKDRWDVAQLHR